MPYFTYILYSNITDRYYVGSCEDLVIRLKRHNRHGTKSTKSGIPWVIVYFEQHTTRTEAIARENAIKRKKSRKYIQYLIRSSGG